MSTFVSCRDCGYIEKCPNCDIPLTFHFSNLRLTCHHCNFGKQAPVICPTCKSQAIRYFGTGTQRVEQELQKIIGDKYKIGRMDADTTKSRGSHESIYNSVINNEFDILIGTQMITKGWDIPNVKLVGIISADTMINFPDFTSSEKTFDLLTQVAGRTGRGEHPGKAIIQTYNPDHFAVKTAAKHDYLKFYNEEIKNREELKYPPFAILIKLLYNNVVQEVAEEEGYKAYERLYEALNSKGINFSILGPSPAFIPKMSGKYYFQIVIKILDNKEEEIIKVVDIIKNITKDRWSIDVDPMDLL